MIVLNLLTRSGQMALSTAEQDEFDRKISAMFADSIVFLNLNIGDATTLFQRHDSDESWVLPCKSWRTWFREEKFSHSRQSWSTASEFARNRDSRTVVLSAVASPAGKCFHREIASRDWTAEWVRRANYTYVHDSFRIRENIHETVFSRYFPGEFTRLSQHFAQKPQCLDLPGKKIKEGTINRYYPEIACKCF